MYYFPASSSCSFKNQGLYFTFQQEPKNTQGYFYWSIFLLKTDWSYSYKHPCRDICYDNFDWGVPFYAPWWWLKPQMIFFTRPHTLFYFFLHISDLNPVMIITYTQKPRITVLLSSKKQTCAYSKFCNIWSKYWPSPSACKWRRRLNPLLVDEGGSWPWQITSLFDSVVFLLLCLSGWMKL